MHAQRDHELGRSELQPTGRLVRGGLSSLLIAALTSCVHAYQLPRENEPHAVVKFRIALHAAEGPQRAVSVSVNDEIVHVTGPVSHRGTSMSSVLVRPEATHWNAGVSFSHTEERQVQETYYVNETTTCTEYDYTTHSMQTRSCTRSVARQRTVTRTVTVVDGACTDEVFHSPAVNDLYLLQFDYFASGHCNLSCYRQIPGMNDTFTLLPCSQTQ